MSTPQAPSNGSTDTASCRTWIMIQGSVGAFLPLGGFHCLMPATTRRSHASFCCSMCNGCPSLCFVRSVRLPCSHVVPSLTFHRRKVRFCFQSDHGQANTDTPQAHSLPHLFAFHYPSHYIGSNLGPPLPLRPGL